MLTDKFQDYSYLAIGSFALNYPQCVFHVVSLSNVSIGL